MIPLWLVRPRERKRKTLHGQYVNDINAVLTPDQQKSWAAANAARLERFACPQRAGAKTERFKLPRTRQAKLARDLLAQSPAPQRFG